MNILITGGASGLGEAITRKLAGNVNNRIYFTYHSSRANAIELEKQFPNTVSIKCDFTSQQEMLALSNRIQEIDLDVLINNAFSGDAIKTYFHKIPAGDFLTDFQDNIIPTVTLTQSAINSFRKRKKGKIITILTSFLINTPPLGSSVYVANKAYLKSLVKSWATENIKFNIASNSISPSFMLSALTKDTDERVLEELIASHPLKKLLTTEEVAETVLFLANASPHINGTDIVINAGTNIK